MKNKPETIDEYILAFPEEVQQVLQQIRQTIRRAVPDAEEKISYGMPSFHLDGKYLIYFAAHKKHIGLYPVPNGREEFAADFSVYKTSGKGTIQFPLGEPMPFDLIARIARFREQETRNRLQKN